MDAVAVLKKITPWIGAAASAGAPFVPFLAPVAAAIGKITGKEVTTDPGSLVDAIAGATPEQRVEILKLHDDFAANMQAMGFKHDEEILGIDAKDRDSARSREIAVRDRMPAALAILAVVSLMFCISLVAFAPLTDKAIGALLTLVGFVGAAFKDVYAYFFGSSAGSDRKTELLAAAPAVKQ
jgi:hypothetical protein